MVQSASEGGALKKQVRKSQSGATASAAWTKRLASRPPRILRGKPHSLSKKPGMKRVTIENVTVSPKQARQALDSQGVIVIRQALPKPILRDLHTFLQSRPDLDERGQYRLAVRLDEQLREIPYYLADQSWFCELFDGEKPYLHMPPMARCILPGDGSGAVPAHQDLPYNRHMEKFSTVWVPLVKIDKHCGGMAVYPRTHNSGEFSRGADGPRWLGAVDASSLHRVELQPLGPGDLVVLHSLVVHESMPNRSTRPRISFDYRFFGRNVRSSKHCLDLKTRKVIEPERAIA